jgi:hypothetical protein
MTSESNLARTQADATATGPFVINLCSSTTPMALRIPDAPGLKRFSFFVSRRREEGRERFRLHMGHFASLAEAEEWLRVVRDLYPGAWAGEAPGKKLRAAQEAAAAAGHAAAAAPAALPRTAPAPAAARREPAPVAATVKAPVSAPAGTPAPPPPAVARPPIEKDATASWPPPAPRRPPPSKPSSGAASGTRQKSRSPPRSIPVVQAAKPRPARAPESAVASPQVPAPPVPAAPVPAPPAPAARLAQSNVREVLANLDSADDAEATRRMRIPARPPRASPAAPTAVPPPAAPAAPEVRAEEAGLTDTQVLRMLERRRDAAAKAATPASPPAAAAEEIQLLRPDDLSTMTELRQGLSANAMVFFAVQLEWSVRPIDLKRVAPLAIFSAYTLYTVEGNREGRKWYGLRLGFFSDSISAKQVALYVRSEFKSVAVIPVSGREKMRAVEDGRLPVSALGQAHHREKPADEFKLSDSTEERAALSVPPPAPKSTPAPQSLAGGAGRAAAPAGDRRRLMVRPPARQKTVEETLEETLEILGADKLTLDDGRKPFINSNEEGARTPGGVPAETGTGTFAKLLDRLSDRLIRGR